MDLTTIAETCPTTAPSCAPLLPTAPGSCPSGPATYLPSARSTTRPIIDYPTIIAIEDAPDAVDDVTNDGIVGLRQPEYLVDGNVTTNAANDAHDAIDDGLISDLATCVAVRANRSSTSVTQKTQPLRQYVLGSIQERGPATRSS